MKQKVIRQKKPVDFMGLWGVFVLILVLLTAALSGFGYLKDQRVSLENPSLWLYALMGIGLLAMIISGRRRKRR